MILANDPQGLPIQPRPHLRGTCRGCGSEMVAKCGPINAWHWAHLSRTDCDPWKEHESEWHLRWKNRWPVECQERFAGEHRADVLSPAGLVIEFQNSSISKDMIQDREKFWRNMVWVINAAPFIDRFTLTHCIKPERFYRVTWEQPRRSWFYAYCPKFFDIGTGLIEVWTWGGWTAVERFGIEQHDLWAWGQLHTYPEFLDKFGAASPRKAAA